MFADVSVCLHVNSNRVLDSSHHDLKEHAKFSLFMTGRIVQPVETLL